MIFYFSLKYTFLFSFILLGIISESYASNDKQNIYLIPGQGSDSRVFKNLEFDTLIYNIHYIKWEIPNKGEDLKSYAKRLSAQIDSTKDFYLIGVSLGGMIATEINDILEPKKVVLISSAKSRKELPWQYKFQKAVPIYKIIPKKLIKSSVYVVQPLVEPDRRKEKETFVAMIDDKDPVFLKRTIEMIIGWDRIDFDSNIIHIHGNKDHTLPIKNISYDHLVEDGSHMMVLTRSQEINKIITYILNP